MEVLCVFQPMRLAANTIARECEMLRVFAVRGLIVSAEDRKALALSRQSLADGAARVACRTLRRVGEVHEDLLVDEAGYIDHTIYQLRTARKVITLLRGVRRESGLEVLGIIPTSAGNGGGPLDRAGGDVVIGVALVE